MQSNLNKDDANSTILNLEVLKKEYDATLIKYNQAQSDYASLLSAGANTFADIKGKTYLGTGVLSEDWTTTTLEDCKEACASNSKCSGATYNLDKTYCSLKTGESGVSDGSENDYAILSDKQKQLKVLSALSDRLLEINNEILQIVKKQGKPELVEIQREKALLVSALANNYSDLTTQRESLNQIIRETQKLSRAENQSQIVITKNYSTYIVLMLLTIMVGVGVARFSSIGNSKSSKEESASPPPPLEPSPPEVEEAEAEEEEIPQQGGRYNPKYRHVILVVVSVFMVILISRLATSCCDYINK